MIKDAVTKMKVQKALSAVVASGTTDLASAAIDVQDKLGLMFAASVGVSGDTLSGSLKLELFLSECDTEGGSYTAVADAEVDGVVSGGAQTGTFAIVDDAAEDDAVYKCGYKGHKRYVKANVNLVGTHTNGTPISIMSIALPMKLPA